jgi:hypothetical protein
MRLPDLAETTVCDEVAGGGKFGCMDKSPAPTIRDLYPHLNDEQLAEVDDTWERYLALVLRIFERLESGSGADAPYGHLTQNTDEIPCDS